MLCKKTQQVAESCMPFPGCGRAWLLYLYDVDSTRTPSSCVYWQRIVSAKVFTWKKKLRRTILQQQKYNQIIRKNNTTNPLVLCCSLSRWKGNIPRDLVVYAGQKRRLVWVRLLSPVPAVGMSPFGAAIYFKELLVYTSRFSGTVSSQWFLLLLLTFWDLVSRIEIKTNCCFHHHMDVFSDGFLYVFSLLSVVKEKSR